MGYAMKETLYSELIAKVKASYDSYSSTEQEDELRLYWCEDCKEINLWTYWQGRNNLNAEIMLVGQDWGSPWDCSTEYVMGQIRLANQGLSYDYLANNPSITDERMVSLFHEIGFDIQKPCDKLFFTNFILGYRSKGLSGGYKKAWAERDKGFFCELANIVEPKVILCMARSTFEGVLDAFSVKLSPGLGNYNKFIESERNPVPVTLENGETTHIFALAHCGALGTMNRNRGKGKLEDVLEPQRNDWKRIAPYL